MNNNKLRSIMVLNGDTGKSLAEYLGISENSFSNKSTGKTEFTQSEIKAIVVKYHMDEIDVVDTFFS